MVPMVVWAWVFPGETLNIHHTRIFCVYVNEKEKQNKTKQRKKRKQTSTYFKKNVGQGSWNLCLKTHSL